MPLSSTSLDGNISGAVVGTSTDTFASVTYDASYLYASPNGEGALDQIPSFLYLTGAGHYRMDSQGNVLYETENRDGSLPV